MTESRWLREADIFRLLAFVWPGSSTRKRVLYQCGGCRHIARLLYNEASTRMVEVSERFADGNATAEELGDAAWAAEGATFGFDFEPSYWESDTDPRMKEWKKSTVAKLVELGALAPSAAAGGEWKVNAAVKDRLLDAARVAEACAGDDLPRSLSDKSWSGPISQLGWPGRELVDCVFGNPFRPVTPDPVWRTSTTLTLARQMYDSRDFMPMPVLADALQDAGCPDGSPLVGHCRGGGPHARGCWVVDLILGKS